MAPRICLHILKRLDWQLQSFKHFLGPKSQEIRIFFPQKSGGYQEFFSIKSNDFIQNYK